MSTGNTAPPLTIAQYVIDTGPAHAPLKAAIKRYTPMSSSKNGSSTGYILVFVHGTGFVKELWEPIIERILVRDAVRPKVGRKILECWAIDCQTHGASAPLNDDTLFKHPKILDIYVYGDAIVQLCQSGLLSVCDHTKQKVVLIGHSAGAIAAVLATKAFEAPSAHPFNQLILVDPPLLSEESRHKMTPMFRQVQRINPKRLAVWDSKEDARKFIENTLPYKVWDRRSRDLYIENGLRALPTPFQKKQNGVTLACKPVDEAAGFENQHHAIDALNQLTEISTTTPIHFIFGARNDMFSREVQDVMYDQQAGRKAASVVRVKDAGHLVMQEKPEALADAISDILIGISSKL